MLTLVSYKFLKGQRGFGALAHVKGESFPGFPGERGCAQRGEAKVKLRVSSETRLFLQKVRSSLGLLAPPKRSIWLTKSRNQPNAALKFLRDQL